MIDNVPNVYIFFCYVSNYQIYIGSKGARLLRHGLDGQDELYVILSTDFQFSNRSSVSCFNVFCASLGLVLLEV